MSKISRLLKQPYPITENEWWIIIPITLFVSLFIFLFQPFGLSMFKSSLKIYILIGYGAVTFLILIINLFLIPKIFTRFFNERNWTLGKNLLFICWILFTIGISNFIYSDFFFTFRISPLKMLLMFQFFTLVVGAFPSTILVISNQNRLLKRNLAAAEELSSFIQTDEKYQETEPELIKIQSEGGNDDIIVKDSELLFIEAQGNYVSIVYFHNQKVQRNLIRATMKRIEESLSSYDYIFRCHREYIVNLNQIVDISGNSQGICLKLKYSDHILLV